MMQSDSDTSPTGKEEALPQPTLEQLREWIKDPRRRPPQSWFDDPNEEIDMDTSHAAPKYASDAVRQSVQRMRESTAKAAVPLKLSWLDRIGSYFIKATQG